MIRSRLERKALVMCALIIGLMAVWAGVAQAENTGGSWTYINSSGQLKTFEGELAEPEIGGRIEVGTVLVLHTEALEGTKVLYECGAFSAVAGAKLKSNGIVLGKFRFTGCGTFLNGALSLPCFPVAQTIETNLIKAQMLLHKLASGTIDKILIGEGEAAEGKPANLATIETVGACALGTKIPVGGKVATLPSNPTTHESEHLVKEFLPLTAMWILSNTPEHKAEILGSGWAVLAGVHTFMQWAGLWN